jgi:hypothetical protein
MNKRTILAVLRLALGITTLVAFTLQGLVLGNAGVFSTFNYFGYFTNLSNVFASVVLILSALYLFKSRKPSVRDDVIRGAAVLYMAVTGVVYVTLLTGEDLGLLLPWVNILMHIIMPLAVVADWLYQPPLTTLTTKQAALWLAFPLLFVVYTIIRGAIVNWYPYPFLNPDKVGGYGGVALYCAGILAAFFVIGWLVMKLGNALKRQIR